MIDDYEFTPGSSWNQNPPPAITCVVIESWTGDEPIARPYPNLETAERALLDAAQAHLEFVGGNVHALVRVEWSDGAVHRAPIDLDARRGAWRPRGLIKSTLIDQGDDLAHEADRDLRAWGNELQHRMLHHNDSASSLSEWTAWNDSIAFIPSNGEAPPPLDTVTVFVAEVPDRTPPTTGTAWATLAQAEASVARFVAGRRAAQRTGYVHVTVAWRDGMRFRTWGAVAELAARPLVLVNEMNACARYVASPAFAERNARTVPLRPLVPQRAWARELLRRAAVLAGGR